MDLRQLKYFTAAVQTGSISAAARRCSISQPSLSQQIKVLEEDIGESLLVRQTRGVVPTAAGELLYAHAERLLKEEELLRAQFNQRNQLQAGRLSFGIIPTMAPYLLPRILGPFRKLYPAIQISVREARTDSLIESVGNGSLEFAILSDVDDESQKKWSLHTKPLFSEPLVLALPAGHDLALPSANPQPKDVEGEELVHLRDGHCLTEQTVKACRLTTLNPSLQCDQLETALAMVRSGLGIAIVPEFAIRKHNDPELVFRNFIAPQPERVISLMTLRQSKLAPPAEALVTSLASAFSKQKKSA